MNELKFSMRSHYDSMTVVCAVCDKPYEKHGSYPTYASHSYTSDGRCGAVGTIERGQFIGLSCPGAECVEGCVRIADATLRANH